MNQYAYESEFLQEWLDDMQMNHYDYHEPIIEETTRNIIRLACGTLKQDIHVYVMTVDIVEKYIRKKDSATEIIEDPMLVITTIIFIASKYLGQQDLKIAYIIAYLGKITGKSYNPQSVKIQEMEILNTLDNNLPIFNRVDDLKCFVVKFEFDAKLKFTLLPLSLRILELLYVKQPKWFSDFKNIYATTPFSLEVFKNMIKNRVFMPAAIVIYIIKNTAYNSAINVDGILKEMSEQFNLHSDLVNTLVGIINHIIHS